MKESSFLHLELQWLQWLGFLARRTSLFPPVFVSIAHFQYAIWFLHCYDSSFTDVLKVVIAYIRILKYHILAIKSLWF